MNRYVGCAALLILSLSACAGPLRGMREIADGAPSTAPPSGKASVVFMRPSTLGYAIASSVFEIRDGRDVFVGHVPAKHKLVHHTDPGAMRFMVVSEAADFLQAELEAGKTYYVLVTPRFGVWRARFSLRPVPSTELDATEFREWFDGCVWVETTDEARDWARRSAASVAQKKEEYLKKWEPRTDKPSLWASDGR